MAVYSKVKLSGSTDGKGIKVAAAATPGTTIHDAHATALDEVWLWAWNSNTTTERLLTLELGGVTDPDNIVEVKIPVNTKGSYLVVPGWIFTNTMNLDAFADAANEIVIYGYVNRIT